MSVIRRPIAQRIGPLFHRHRHLFLESPETGSPAHTTQERQRGGIVTIFAHRSLCLFVEELKQRRQFITGCSFCGDAADSFSDRAVQSGE